MAPLTRQVVDLGLSPLSNALLSDEDLKRPEVMYPLQLYVCDRCWLVQLPESAKPEQIFSDYVYISSYADAWLRHVRQYATSMIERLSLGPQSLVMEVGSNDGHLLRCFSQRGVPVLGIEPAANVAAIAERNGVRTAVVFLGAKTAQELRSGYGEADLIAGNNVLAHVPALNDFVEGLRLLLKPAGTLTMEFPHLLHLIDKVEYDTIYHEHFSYFSLAVAQRVFAAHALSIYDVDEIPTHGGSLRIYAAHADQRRPESERVGRVLASERDAGLENAAAYEGFARRVVAAKASVEEFFGRAAAEGVAVAGYGAPAKATTLLNYCGIKTRQLPYTVDRSPLKQHRYIPGVRIPIEPVETLLQRRPRYVFVLAWNWADEVLEQMKAVRGWGGEFVLPVPTVQVK